MSSGPTLCGSPEVAASSSYRLTKATYKADAVPGRGFRPLPGIRRLHGRGAAVRGVKKDRPGAARSFTFTCKYRLNHTPHVRRKTPQIAFRPRGPGSAQLPCVRQGNPRSEGLDNQKRSGGSANKTA